MEDQAECMLVLIGATPEGRKELVGFQVGVRESAQSWRAARRREAASAVDRALAQEFGTDRPIQHLLQALGGGWSARPDLYDCSSQRLTPQEQGGSSNRY